MNLDSKLNSSPISIGDQALQLALNLSKLNESIKVLKFKTYFPLPTLDRRLAAPEDKILNPILEKTAELKSLTENFIPYWELVFAVSWNTPKSDLFIHEALKHDKRDEAIELFEVQIDSSAKDRILNKVAGTPSDGVLALCSTCINVDGLVKHIPMMDFRCKPTASNLKKIRIALAELGQKRGAILQSGRSYHYYGFDLLNQEDWVKFLAKCLLLAPIADARYIAHRLIEGIGALRITASETKPETPFIVDIL